MESDRSKTEGDSKKKLVDANADVVTDEDLKFYLSGLFNIETSPVFKNLDQLKGKKDITNEKYAIIR